MDVHHVFQSMQKSIVVYVNKEELKQYLRVWLWFFDHWGVDLEKVYYRR